MAHFDLTPLKEFLRDVKRNPDSFKGLNLPVLIKAIKDIENQSLHCKIDDGLFLSNQIKPKYINNVMLMSKPGFKDVTGDKLIPGVVMELLILGAAVQRVQLVICASEWRPVHVALRFKYNNVPNWVVYECTTSTVVSTFKFFLR